MHVHSHTHTHTHTLALNKHCETAQHTMKENDETDKTKIKF